MLLKPCNSTENLEYNTKLISNTTDLSLLRECATVDSWYILSLVSRNPNVTEEIYLTVKANDFCFLHQKAPTIKRILNELLLQ